VRQRFLCWLFDVYEYHETRGHIWRCMAIDFVGRVVAG
jgi:hypothetical protein